MYVMYVCRVDEDDVGEIDENVDHKRDVNEIDIDHVADQKKGTYKRRSKNVRVHIDCAHSHKTVVALLVPSITILPELHGALLESSDI